MKEYVLWQKNSSALPPAVVQTNAGKLRGFVVDGTYTFHGIKYADAKRFQMPQRCPLGGDSGRPFLRLCQPHPEPGNRFW